MTPKDDKVEPPTGRAGRNYARVQLDAFVRILAPSGADREYVFRTRDLSPTGLFLYTRVGHLYPIQVGAVLSVELHDFDQAIQFQAVVVRTIDAGSAESEHYPVGFGLRIEQITPENETRMALLIERATKGAVY